MSGMDVDVDSLFSVEVGARVLVYGKYAGVSDVTAVCIGLSPRRLNVGVPLRLN